MKACLIIACALATFAPNGKTAGNDACLFDVTDRANLPGYLPTDCQATIVRSEAGQETLQVRFGCHSSWPGLQFRPDQLEYTADWSEYALLGLTVSNPSDVPVRIGLRVDSALDAAKGWQGITVIAPGQTVRMLLPLERHEPIIGMRGQPPMNYSRRDFDVLLPCSGSALDLKQITRFLLFVGQPRQEHTILLHRVELIRSIQREQSAFVDRFGQYNGDNWPGKLLDEGQLAARRRAENAYFAANPPLPDRDRYGGWKDGPRLDATGRFRIQKHEGRWWLVDPDGSLFWSSGITCARLNGETVVAGREGCFEWLPEQGDPLARFYAGEQQSRTFDFSKANAYRKYGGNFTGEYYDITLKRFQSWGINTIGNWSAPETWRLKRVPYTLPVHPARAPAFVATSRAKAGMEMKKWFPDPFDPRFRQELRKQLASHAELKDDPWLLGVFIDNELPWTMGEAWRQPDHAPTGIAALCLQKNDGTFPAKRALVDWLQRKYSSIHLLNRAWGTGFNDWETFGAPFELTEPQRLGGLSDLTELDKLIAHQYFRICREEMNQNLPGVLYLGCRFSGMYDRHIVDVARAYCDVVSFNIYADRPSDRTADELAEEFDFPVLIGEFHFGALDRGMFDPGLCQARDQDDRASRYAAYVREAAAAPWCVGAHWFQYLDQALTGRPDGENYNIGFVDATDEPYPEMREAARKVHAQLYQIRTVH